MAGVLDSNWDEEQVAKYMALSFTRWSIGRIYGINPGAHGTDCVGNRGDSERKLWSARFCGDVSAVVRRSETPEQGITKCLTSRFSQLVQDIDELIIKSFYFIFNLNWYIESYLMYTA